MLSGRSSSPNHQVRGAWHTAVYSGMLEAGQNFQGILPLEVLIPETPHSKTRSARWSSPTLQERKRSSRLCNVASLAQSLEASSMSRGPRK